MKTTAPVWLVVVGAVLALGPPVLAALELLPHRPRDLDALLILIGLALSAATLAVAFAMAPGRTALRLVAGAGVVIDVGSIVVFVLLIVRFARNFHI